MFDKMSRLPEPGSLVEFVTLMVWRMRQDIEWQKSRVMVQALLSQQGAEGEHIKKAFEDLKQAFFPHDKVKKGYEEKKLREVLMREISRGPLHLSVLADPTRGRYEKKLVRGKEALRRKEEERRTGQVTQIDRQAEARKRGRRTSNVF